MRYLWKSRPTFDWQSIPDCDDPKAVVDAAIGLISLWLVDLHLTIEEDEYVLVLRLATAPSTDAAAVEMRCSRVKNLAVKGESRGIISGIGLAITDRRSDQLEGVGWSVHDFEEDAIRFYCESIKVRMLISPPTNR